MYHTINSMYFKTLYPYRPSSYKIRECNEPVHAQIYHFIYRYIYVCPVPLRLYYRPRNISFYLFLILILSEWSADRKSSNKPAGVVILTFFDKRFCRNHTLINCFLAPYHKLWFRFHFKGLYYMYVNF